MVRIKLIQLLSRRKWLWALVLTAYFCFSPTWTLAQQFEGAALKTVLKSIESSTSFRFLYRDGLIAGRTVSVDLGQDPIRAVSALISSLGMGVKVDAERSQILVYPLASGDQTDTGWRLVGYVIDGSSGARLPFATITWLDPAGKLRGVSANAAGEFEAELTVASERITVSYLGFEATTVGVSAADRSEDISVRLEPRPVLGGEVVVSGTILHSDLDSTWQHLIKPGVLAPLGESSILRSLEALPSVSISPALSDGMVVRGSKSDGFQVLLDGLPIYSRSHMFGLFDAFNEDALQQVGFYYGIAPASYQAPPGGTVSFLTRTGSRERVSGSLGASSTSLQGTIEGPMGGGRGSWLISGRKSYLDDVDWFGNSDLIAQGLDVGRETSLVGSERGPFQALEGSADYHDVHANLYLEGRSGNQLSVTGYTGGDQTAQSAQRRLAGPNGVAGQNSSANSTWGASAVGLRYQSRLMSYGFLNLTGGVTAYDGTFLNDSVVAGRRNQEGAAVLRLDSFRNDNRLNQLRFAPEITFGRSGVWSAGAEVNAYESRYTETTGERGIFELNTEAVQTDLYLGYASPRHEFVRYEIGLRSHYYSLGNYQRLSPRVNLSAGGEGVLSGSVGYSRNYQFLHQLEVEPVQESAPNVWILSSETESPGSVDYYTAGLYLRPAPDVFVQAEVYYKRYSNLRLHESANPDPANAGLIAELTNPWLTNIDGSARGFEVMLRHRTGPVLWSHAYTLSRTVYTNPRVLSGRDFLVSWDRKHQYVASADVRLGAFQANMTWSASSGTPNDLRFRDNSEQDRLPMYHRMDVGLSWERLVASRTLSAGVSVYNLYDRSNVWYRTAVPSVVSGPAADRRVDETIPVDVYDLGFHPSFRLAVRF
ncbi:MAG: hypothetical protein ACI9W4_000909 [Rhodothermales bacterium]